MRIQKSDICLDKASKQCYTLAQYHANTIKNQTERCVQIKVKGNGETPKRGFLRLNGVFLRAVCMNKLHCENVDRVFKAVLSLEDLDECYAFFEDLCTAKELMDMAQRFEVATLLSRGNNYASISAKTGASTATISRVNKSVLYGNDGYKTAIERLDKKEKSNG